MAVTGAADIPVELIRRVDAELSFSVIITGYGLTEGGHGDGHLPRRRCRDHRHHGRTPTTGIRAAHRRRRGQLTWPPGSPGRSSSAGAASCPTTSTIRKPPPRPCSTDGWLRTGDLGIVDPAGCLRIVGRSKDMFIVGGFNAYPAEIENGLLGHPDITAGGRDRHSRRAAGRGRHGLRGACGPAPRSTGDEIIGWCRDQMANYKVPRAVELVDDLPLNATGKVVKDVLRAARASRTAPGPPA